MNISEYFLKANEYPYQRLQSEPLYCKTIENFYENFIRPHFKKMFEDNRYNFIKWCEVLEDYVDSSLPVFWVRKFESGSGKENTNDNRRTGTTVLVDKANVAIATFSYISNFDAQELYNIILNVDPSTAPDEFMRLMLGGRYQFHYDNGKGSKESEITSYDCLTHANSLGVFNRASLYLAHITDVNGAYASATDYEFTPGDTKDWKEISTYTGYDFLDLFFNNFEKKIRVLEYAGDADSLRKYFKAHFFRFVHPFNYYLVPGKNYEINAIMGKTNVSVGEYKDLTNYVRYRMYVDFIEKDDILKKHFAIFESNILIDEDKKISKKFEDIERQCKTLGDIALHIVYGALIGNEGKLLKKLSEKITNADDLYDLYIKYEPGDAVAFYNEEGKEIKCYKPKTISDFPDFLDKLSKLQFGKETFVETKLVKELTHDSAMKASTASRSTAESQRGSRKYDKEIGLKAVAYYLRYNKSLIEVEKEILKITEGNKGSTAQYILKSFGVDTSKTGHKGLLLISDIDTEIAKAKSELFKDTLEKIKEKGYDYLSLL